MTTVQLKVTFAILCLQGGVVCNPLLALKQIQKAGIGESLAARAFSSQTIVPPLETATRLPRFLAMGAVAHVALGPLLLVAAGSTPEALTSGAVSYWQTLVVPGLPLAVGALGLRVWQQLRVKRSSPQEFIKPSTVEQALAGISAQAMTAAPHQDLSAVKRVEAFYRGYGDGQLRMIPMKTFLNIESFLRAFHKAYQEEMSRILSDTDFALAAAFLSGRSIQHIVGGLQAWLSLKDVNAGKLRLSAVLKSLPQALRSTLFDIDIVSETIVLYFERGSMILTPETEGLWSISMNNEKRSRGGFYALHHLTDQNWLDRSLYFVVHLEDAIGHAGDFGETLRQTA